MSSDSRLLDTLHRELGPEVLALLRNPLVTNVFRNPDGQVWFAGPQGTELLSARLTTPAALSLVNAVAASRGRLVAEATAILETTLPAELHNIRFTALVAPISASPVLAFRRPPSKIYRFPELLETGMLTASQAAFLANAVRERANIAIAGSVDSGKTTFANTLLAELAEAAPAGARVVIIEDTDELQCSVPNTVKLNASAAYSVADLVRSTLRLGPRHIIVGELRGAEAHAAVKAWGTGHPGGLCTLHANGPETVLPRLDHLIREDLPGSPPGTFLPFLAGTISVVVHITLDDSRRRRIAVRSVEPDRGGQPRLKEIP